LSLKRIVLAFVFARLAWADGGALVFTQQDGPYIVTVFSAPEPVRVGGADLSVLVERSSDRTAVLDAQVKIELRHAQVDTLEATATHAKATNKLLYATQVSLPTAGKWKIFVEADGQQGSAHATGDLRVLPPQTALLLYWPYFALVPLMMALFALNQWLKRSRARPQARA
jgi:hypothetical protein